MVLSVSLSACGAGNVPAGFAAAPAAHVGAPLTSSVVVKAVYGKSPIKNLLITLTHNSWPHGKLITKGKTDSKGTVMLSGTWTKQDVVCAGGRYHYKPGLTIVDSKCPGPPLPKKVELQYL
jgi:hypothetical protein